MVTLQQKQHTIQKGDIFMVDLPETAGREQRKRRPVIVVSNDWIIQNSDVVKVVPVTSKKSSFPLHIDLPEGIKTYGQAMTQQERAIDLVARNAEYVEACPADFMEILIDELVAGY